MLTAWRKKNPSIRLFPFTRLLEIHLINTLGAMSISTPVNSLHVSYRHPLVYFRKGCLLQTIPSRLVETGKGPRTVTHVLKLFSWFLCTFDLLLYEHLFDELNAYKTNQAGTKFYNILSKDLYLTHWMSMLWSICCTKVDVI